MASVCAWIWGGGGRRRGDPRAGAWGQARGEGGGTRGAGLGRRVPVGHMVHFWKREVATEDWDAQFWPLTGVTGTVVLKLGS